MDPGLSKPARHILVPVDESKASTQVLDYTIQHMYRDGDVIHLFHCIPPGTHIVYPNEIGMEEVVEDDEATRQRMENAAREFLTTTFVSKLEEQKIPYQIEIVRFATDADSVGSIICKRAEQLDAAMVVMAKHDKGAIKEFFLGSSTKHCTHHCRAPVLVLHCD